MSFIVDKLIDLNPFNYDLNKKNFLFGKSVNEMVSHHYENCEKYKRFCQNNNFNPYKNNIELFDYPFLPVNIFKNTQLFSVPKKELITKVESSATTSGIPSKIYIDLETSRRQIKTSSAVMSDFLHSSRHDFFILDSDPRKKLTAEMTARIAATRGFLILAKHYEYFMEFDKNHKLFLQIEKFIDKCNSYISRRNDSLLTIFGFTFIVYEYVISKLIQKGVSLNIKGAKLAHIGGWKKLIDKKVDNDIFKKDVHTALGILPNDIIDFYGFTEQMGILYGETKSGYKITPAYSEIIIRDVNTLEPLQDGEEGFIQTISPIFSSYPGVSVLTEDIGRIITRNNSECGRLGTCFEILGRAKDSELRGCGDLMEEKMVI